MLLTSLEKYGSDGFTEKQVGKLGVFTPTTHVSCERGSTSEESTGTTEPT